MIKSKKGYQIVAMLMAILLAFTSVFMLSVNQTVFADEITDLQKKIEQLEAENKKLNSSINSRNSKIQDQEERQAALKTQIQNTEKQITLFNQKIGTMEKNIETKNNEITAKSSEISKNEDVFSQRVRAMYISGSTSMLTTVLGAKSFSEFLTRAEVLKRISQSDQDLIATLNAEKTDLAAIKADMEKQNAALKTTKDNLKSTSASLEGLKKDSEATKAALEVEQAKELKERAANKKEIKQQETLIDKIIAERQAANQGSAPAEGTYKWPIPTSSRISSPYGYRSWGGIKEFHWGIDIPAPSGTAIVAANPGTVILVKNDSYGYGHHIVIDHGGGQATLYGHCSRIDVKEGDVVTRGQTIGGVGTTGQSTGNHTHFEVRVNGIKKDPMGFVNKP